MGGPEFIRKIDKAVSGHGYVGTEYNMINGTFKTYSEDESNAHGIIPIQDTKVRMTDPTKTQFEVKFGGSEWRLVTESEFNRYLKSWQVQNDIRRTNEEQI